MPPARTRFRNFGGAYKHFHPVPEKSNPNVMPFIVSIKMDGTNYLCHFSMRRVDPASPVKVWEIDRDSIKFRDAKSYEFSTDPFMVNKLNYEIHELAEKESRLQIVLPEPFSEIPSVWARSNHKRAPKDVLFSKSMQFGGNLIDARFMLTETPGAQQTYMLKPGAISYTFRGKSSVLADYEMVIKIIERLAEDVSAANAH
ncbi:MAG: hypothetical protein COV47_03485 [Candidatus Diapherotrites archaeon CG11_big_fil_rev_8_21_14_0_20_37_9]|nr:MAG: hypothetical protein COV47_03485 [Candidatus Diapherotrites archaeon CG11_big_fil_rev_8_21_14_0_20_37_9]